jgi:hypothetical protein
MSILPLSSLPVVGFPAYRVTPDGRLWKEKQGVWQRIFPYVMGKGKKYLYATLAPGDVVKPMAHIVLEAFVGPRPDGTESCHYPDPNPGNNDVANLRWDTPCENAKDKTRDLESPDGKRCGRCKEDKPLAAFHKNKAAKDGLQIQCIECFKIKRREYSARKLERHSNFESTVHESSTLDLNVTSSVDS